MFELLPTLILTTVLIEIWKIGTGVAIGLILMLINNFIKTRNSEPSKSQTDITINIEQNNTFYTLPQDTAKPPLRFLIRGSYKKKSKITP